MAARATVPNTPLLNRHANVEDVPETRLPSGGCNYTNLSTAGGNAPICGCKRFWDKAQTGYDQRGVTASGFCMCEHHACYHDDVSESYTPRPALDTPAPIGSPTLSTIPNTPRQVPPPTGHLRPEPADLRHLQEPSIPDTLQWSRRIQSGSPFGLPAIPSQCLLPSETGSVTSGSQSRYLRPFGGMGLQTLSHVPTKRGSDNVLKPLEPSKIVEKPPPKMQIYQDAHGNNFLQSVTEAATPSPRASQEPRAAADYVQNITQVQGALNKLAAEGLDNPMALRTGKQDENPQIYIKRSESNTMLESLATSNENCDPILIPRLRTLVNHLADYPTKMRNHEYRLDVLENTAWSNAAIEDLQACDDRLDDRVGELEARLLELEKAQAAANDAGSVDSRRIDGSFSSKASNTSSNLVSVAINRIDVTRVEALEADVAELQAASLPTYSRPWEVEVVFMPYGSQLMGIWSHHNASSSQHSRHGSTAPDDWTQTQNNSMAVAQACLASSERAAWERSATDLSQPEAMSWLMPRACGLRSRVDERLRSRGLVKLAQIRGPDARDVQAAIMTAFGDLPEILTADPYTEHDEENPGAIPDPLTRYLGLQAPWIPLRKLHKDSCLRFLNPAEMITPSLWTVPFLSSSVAMRHSGVRRLYVTQRDSYIQNLTTGAADWTWQKLRQLPRVYPDHSSFDHTPEADAHEPCWEFDERLDPPHESIHSSFASHISSLSIRSPPHEVLDNEPTSPSDHFSSAAVSPDPSTTPTSIAPPTGPSHSPLRERNPFRTFKARRTSMPQTIPTKSSQSSKRRIASFEQSSPCRAPAPLNTTLKRRRISRSPSRPRNTPRWSNGPPSPYTFSDEREVHTDRAITPFAYATPHSNAPYIERARSEIGIYEDKDVTTNGGLDYEGYDANALSDFVDESSAVGPGERHTEEVWEGVADDEDDGNDGAGSEASSVPSEYPSTQQHHASGFGIGLGVALSSGGLGKSEFRIHVDEEEEVDEL